MDLFSIFRKKRPCYRCGGVASGEYMGLHYCAVCLVIVPKMAAAIGYGGMFGFPGADGYLEFPKLAPIGPDKPIIEKKES